MNKKGAIGLSIGAIISIVVTVIIVVAVASLWFRLFTGQQVTGFNTIAEEINAFCRDSGDGESTSFFTVIPDSIGQSPRDFEFFFVASVPSAIAKGFLGNEIQLEGNVLVLASRRYATELPNDVREKLQFEILGTRIDLALFLPPVKVIRATLLEECAKDDIQLCGCATEPCSEPSNLRCTPPDSFSFEPQEGNENLEIELIRSDNRVTLVLDKKPICGDLRCCSGETELNCPADCDKIRNPNQACARITV